MTTTTFLGPPMERSPITLKDGRVWHGSLYRTARRCGRRIVVTDETSRAVFDTGDHYDQGNAEHALRAWLADQHTS